MLSLGRLIDNFERSMAAVAFAESNDQKTARLLMKPDAPRSVHRASENAREQATNRMELRM